MQRQLRFWQRGANKIWWVDFGKIGGVRKNLTTHHTDRAKAEEVAAKMYLELMAHDQAVRLKKLTIATAAPEWAASINEPSSTAVFDRLWKNAKSRATSAGLVWALCRSDFDKLVAASNGRCAVTGLPFTLTEEPHNPFKPSLDRIDNATGYSIGNCRLVLMAVNYAMNVWGESTFRTIALSFAAEELRGSLLQRRDA